MSLEGMDGGFNEGTEDNVEETIESEESTNEWKNNFWRCR